VRGAPALEALGRVATVLLDKTGTLTTGHPRVVATRGSEEALAAASALEARSTHPLARALAAHLAARGAVSDQEELAGFGVRGRVDGREVLVGRSELLAERGVKRDPSLASGLPEGSTVVHVAVEGEERAAVALRDEPRPEAREAIERLRALGVATAVVSGDARGAVDAVARALGIEDVQAELTPKEKLAAITRRKAVAPEGRLVAMVGDGINDAPALARADVGIALGAGADLAKEAGSVVLARDDLRGVAEAVALGRATLAKIRQNLVLAVGYNVLGIPLAAGLLSRWGVELTPALAGLAMALSSASVVGNALLLARWTPPSP
jgi:Cu+-exporting ATPase